MAILFDFDGTIADTAPGIVLTMQETFREMGLRVPSEEEIRPTIGLQLTKAIQLLGELDDETAEVGRATYSRLFPIFEVSNVTIFPEVPSTLEYLRSKGERLAICTSRNIDSLKLILCKRGYWDFFETVVTNDDHLAPKPAPDMVLHLLEKMNLKKEEAVVVGDTVFDIEMGNSAGCRTIAVTYGNHSKEKLLTVGPNFVADKFDEIPRILGI